jgi:hypothetical protein
MKIRELIKELRQYKDDTEVIFKIVAPEEVSDDDTRDITVKWYGEIGTSLLHERPPILEIGLQYENQEDWSKEWKENYDNYYNDERG